MCGIVGAVLVPGSVQDRRNRLEQSCAILRHRGPDGMGVYVDGAAALGAVRLAIRAPEEGSQPWYASDGSVLVFNGEIYGLARLKARLDAQGIGVRSRCDTVVLAEALSCWGIEILSELDGMFAFAFWNPKDRTLLMARDRWGEKPLYFSETSSGGLAFASEPAALRPWPDIDWRLDKHAFPQFLAHSYLSGECTGWLNVKKVLPGEALCWSPNGVQRLNFFKPDSPAQSSAQSPGQSSATASYGENVASVRSALEHSIRERLASDRPIGLLLSGGIDSSAVAAIATRLVGPLPTWTVSWSDPAYDESAHAQRVATHLGLSHQLIHVEPQHVVAHFDALLEPYGELFADESLLPTGLVCRAAARDVTVLLSGDGGDEMFGGYERYFWRDSPLDEYLDTFCATRAALVASLLSQGGSSAAIHPQHTRLATEHLKEDSVRERRRRVDLVTYLPHDILTKVDRASMQASVEVRAPFLGKSVTDMALALPSAHLWDVALSKAVLRGAVADLLPADILERPKQGFGVPLVHWFRGPLRSWLQDRVLGGILSTSGLLHIDRLEEVVAAHLTGQKNYARLLLNLVVFEYWLRQQQGAERSLE